MCSITVPDLKEVEHETIKTERKKEKYHYLLGKQSSAAHSNWKHHQKHVHSDQQIDLQRSFQSSANRRDNTR